MAGFGPRPFATTPQIILSGTAAGKILIASGKPIVLSKIINAAGSNSVAISLYLATTTAAAVAANRFYNGIAETSGQALPLDVYCYPGLVIEFGAMTTDNITLWYTPLGGGA